MSTRLRSDIPNWILDACAQAKMPPTDLKLYSVKVPNIWQDDALTITLVARDERRYVVRQPIDLQPPREPR